jgi:hypothetical protein
MAHADQRKKSIPHVKCARWQAKHALRAFFRRGREGSFAFAAFRAFSFLLPSPFILESICSECSVASAESRSWSAGDWEPSLASTFISSCIPQPREGGANLGITRWRTPMGSTNWVKASEDFSRKHLSLS